MNRRQQVTKPPHRTGNAHARLRGLGQWPTGCRWLALGVAGAWAGASLLAQTAKTTARTGPATGAATRGNALKSLRIDLKRRRVIVSASVAQEKAMLEFLLCTAGPADAQGKRAPGPKEHESLLKTDAKPSSVHAALLALGLRRGRPARWITPQGKEPVFAPPQGPLLEISLRWTDKQGATHVIPATDWLIEAGTKRRAKPFRWVFVGSNFLDSGAYWADADGHHIGVANFAASVIDVPFESSDKKALLEFAANPKVVPDRGTAVEVIITPVQGAETAPARVAFGVDAFGRIDLEGDPVAPSEIAGAVKKLLARHARCSAEVRLDPRALVYDRERLAAILAHAGLTDVTFRMRGLTEDLMPRTPEQAVKAIAWWKEQFAQAKELLSDPGQDAAVVLKLIAKRRKQLRATNELWGDYEVQLAKLLADYRAKAKPDEKKD